MAKKKAGKPLGGKQSPTDAVTIYKYSSKRKNIPPAGLEADRLTRPRLSGPRSGIVTERRLAAMMRCSGLQKVFKAAVLSAGAIGVSALDVKVSP